MSTSRQIKPEQNTHLDVVGSADKLEALDGALLEHTGAVLVAGAIRNHLALHHNTCVKRALLLVQLVSTHLDAADGLKLLIIGTVGALWGRSAVVPTDKSA